MKKRYNRLLFAVVFVMVGSMAPHVSYSMPTEDDMIDGLSLSVPVVDKTQYIFDASIDTPGEFMAESHMIEETEQVVHFTGDPSAPQPEALMAEDHIYQDTENLSGILNKYGTPAAGIPVQ